MYDQIPQYAPMPYFQPHNAAPGYPVIHGKGYQEAYEAVEYWNTWVKVVNLISVFFMCWEEMDLFVILIEDDGSFILLIVPFVYILIGIALMLRGVQIAKGPDSSTAKTYLNFLILFFIGWVMFFLLLLAIVGIVLAVDNESNQNDQEAAWSIFLVFMGAVGLTIVIGCFYCYLAYKLYTSRLSFEAVLCQPGLRNPEYPPQSMANYGLRDTAR